MIGGEGESYFFPIFNFTLIILVIVALGFLWWRVISFNNANNTTILQIKSKIGSIITEINNSNQLESLIDLDQNNKIGKLQQPSITPTATTATLSSLAGK